MNISKSWTRDWLQWGQVATGEKTPIKNHENSILLIVLSVSF